MEHFVVRKENILSFEQGVLCFKSDNLKYQDSKETLKSLTRKKEFYKDK